MKKKVALSKPKNRIPSHVRKIHCNGFKREDGLLDIEGELLDIKEYDFPLKDGKIKTKGSPVHHMKVRITINEKLEILYAEAITIHGPYEICPKGADNIYGLVGLKIGPGWKHRVKVAIGGKKGCTHITELMGPIATTAFQTLYGEKSREKRAIQKEFEEKEVDTDLPSLTNTCIAYSDKKH